MEHRIPGITRGEPDHLVAGVPLERRTLRRIARCLAHQRRREHPAGLDPRDRKSTRLNSSHLVISYAVFCLKKKNKTPSAAYRLPAYWYRPMLDNLGQYVKSRLDL